MRSVRSKDLSLARTTTSPSRPSSACSAALRWSPSPESTLPSTTMATSSATRTRRPRMPAGRSDVFAAGSGASSPEESTLPHPAQRATQTSRKSGRTNQISAERVASFSANGDVPFARPLYKSCHVARPEVAGNHRMPQVQGPPGAQGRRKRAHVPSLPPGLPSGRRHPQPHRRRRATARRLEAQLNLVAAVLRLLGRCVVGRDQRPVRAHAHGHDLALGDPARDELTLDDRGAFARQLLVVLGLAARIGVTGNLELEAGHTRHVEALLGVDQRVRQILQLLVAAGRELVAVGLEAALVLAPLGQKLGVHLRDSLVARAACRRAARLLGQSAKVESRAPLASVPLAFLARPPKSMACVGAGDSARERPSTHGSVAMSFVMAKPLPLPGYRRKLGSGGEEPSSHLPADRPTTSTRYGFLSRCTASRPSSWRRGRRLAIGVVAPAGEGRSEERRVGKECRSRW